MQGWQEGAPPSSGYWFYRFERGDKPTIIRVTHDPGPPPSIIGEYVGGGRYDSVEEFDGQFWGEKITLPPS
jgi:hypothetical protein